VKISLSTSPILLLQAFFVVCKVLQVGMVAGWSWWWVWSPLWITGSILLGGAALFFLAAMVSVLIERRAHARKAAASRKRRASQMEPTVRGEMW